MAFIAIAALSSFAKMDSLITDHYNYTSKQLHFEITIPAELKDKLITEENESSVVFRYNNLGAKPVFVFSINKIKSSLWMNVKETLSNAVVLQNNGDDIIYCKKTSAASLKGKNKSDYESVVSRIDEIIKSYKSSE